MERTTITQVIQPILLANLLTFTGSELQDKQQKAVLHIFILTITILLPKQQQSDFVSLTAAN